MADNLTSNSLIGASSVDTGIQEALTVYQQPDLRIRNGHPVFEFGLSPYRKLPSIFGRCSRSDSLKGRKHVDIICKFTDQQEELVAERCIHRARNSVVARTSVRPGG